MNYAEVMMRYQFHEGEKIIDAYSQIFYIYVILFITILLKMVSELNGLLSQ